MDLCLTKLISIIFKLICLKSCLICWAINLLLDAIKTCAPISWVNFFQCYNLPLSSFLLCKALRVQKHTISQNAQIKIIFHFCWHNDKNQPIMLSMYSWWLGNSNVVIRYLSFHTHLPSDFPFIIYSSWNNFHLARINYSNCMVGQAKKKSLIA